MISLSCTEISSVGRNFNSPLSIKARSSTVRCARSIDLLPHLGRENYSKNISPTSHMPKSCDVKIAKERQVTPAMEKIDCIFNIS